MGAVGTCLCCQAERLSCQIHLTAAEYQFTFFATFRMQIPNLWRILACFSSKAVPLFNQGSLSSQIVKCLNTSSLTTTFLLVPKSSEGQYPTVHVTLLVLFALEWAQSLCMHRLLYTMWVFSDLFWFWRCVSLSVWFPVFVTLHACVLFASVYSTCQHVCGFPLSKCLFFYVFHVNRKTQHSGLAWHQIGRKGSALAVKCVTLLSWW